jgi:hypothetical protein
MIKKGNWKPRVWSYLCEIFNSVCRIGLRGLRQEIIFCNWSLVVLSVFSYEKMACLLLFFCIYNLNQQSEFTFCKLMLWLLQCLDGESSSGESPVPQIRSIGQFLLSRLFSSHNSSVLRSGFRGFRVLCDVCCIFGWWPHVRVICLDRRVV